MQDSLRAFSHFALRGLAIATKVALGLCLYTFAICGCSSPTVEQCGRPTPEMAVREYYRAFATKDAELFGTVYGVDDSTRRDAERLFKDFLKSGLWYDIDDDIRLETVDKSDKIVRIRSHTYETIALHGIVISSGESGGMFTVENHDGCWYLIGLGISPPPGWVLE